MKAFCPCHVTGFFALRGKGHTISSEGCGIVLSVGATTEATEGSGSVFINGLSSTAPTTATVVGLLTNESMDVYTSLSLPTSCGFGTSGAGAFSTALAVSGSLKLDYSLNALRDVAQHAEIVHKTGVGDVVAQAVGGVVIRRQKGIDRIPAPPAKISLAVFGEISTAQIIRDQEIMRTINTQGAWALKSLDKKPTFETFMALSKEFAYKSGVISEKARDAVEAVEATGGFASMAMLGDAVFAIDPCGALDEFNNVMTTTICHCGAHFVGSTSREISSKMRG
ncbi:MAG: GHMP kinase [Euryarchaeota archaeon]|nr:GHMP kinase [Euryarchaeota archaeon]